MDRNFRFPLITKIETNIVEKQLLQHNILIVLLLLSKRNKSLPLFRPCQLDTLIICTVLLLTQHEYLIISTLPGNEQVDHKLTIADDNSILWILNRF